MQFCTEHWQGLRDEISKRGLADFVSKSGEQVGEKLKAEMQGGLSKDNFDPLMAAHNAIVGAVIRDAGLAAFGEIECPLCLVKANAPEGTVRNWIEGAVGDQAEIAMGLGLATRQ